jgi:hypothetical protein
MMTSTNSMLSSGGARPRSSARRRWFGGAGLLALVIGCGGAAAPEAAPAKEGKERKPDPFAEEAPRTTHPLLAWIDPDATAAVYSRVDRAVDLEAVAGLFAVPPRASHMLRDLRAFDDGLAALMTGTGPAPAEWLSKEALVLMTPSGAGSYLVRGVTRPRAEVEAWMLAAGLQRSVVEGMAVFAPLAGSPDDESDKPQEIAAAAGAMAAAAFPWKVVFLDDTTIGGFSLHELGNGLGPLTAARDLPASDLETQWTRVFREDPELMLELWAGGPMLSLDMSDDVARTHLVLRRWQVSGLDATVELIPAGDAEAPTRAAAELEGRDASLESDAVRELYSRAAFTAEPGVVRGRLQLTDQDLAPLRRAGAG